jgi:hypothetical protein
VVSISSGDGITDAVPFAERCAAAGVFRCISFDTDADFVMFGGFPAQTIYPDGSGSFSNITKDCTVAANGCSLRFKVPAKNNPGAGSNVAGKFEYDFVKDGKRFGQNSTFYVQFRARFDHGMIANNFGGDGWKHILVYGGKTACSKIGLATTNAWYYGFPVMIRDCSSGIYTRTGKKIYMEQGDYNCAYGHANTKDCAYFLENQWMTYYYRIHIGTWGEPNSSLEAWVSTGTGPMKKWINQPNYLFNYEVGVTDVIDKLALTPYITSRHDTEVADSDGHVWYDELIVSSQPIPAPCGPTP